MTKEEKVYGKVKQLMILIDEIQSMSEMGRNKSKMTDLLNSLDDTIIEHVWKLWAYHNISPNDINGWLLAINKHLPKLRRYNKQKAGSGENLSRSDLMTVLVDEPFEHSGDIGLLVAEWEENGYPHVDVPEDRIKDLQKFASKVVDLILSKDGRMSIEPSDKLL